MARRKETYRIVRVFRDLDDTKVVATGLTSDDVWNYYGNPESESRTATSPEGVSETERSGPWFDEHQPEN